MRSDALRRREKIIDAACVLLALHGQYVKLDEVAETAGVGIATLYRNFPTRNALIYECVLRICKDVNNQIDSALAELSGGVEDPEQTFRNLVATVFPLGMNILVPVLLSPPETSLPQEFVDAKRTFMERTTRVLDRARSQGLIHESVTDLDLIMGLIRIYQPPDVLWTGQDTSNRNVDLLVDIYLKGCERGI